MSVEDGLVMTLHPAVRRNHHAAHLRPGSGTAPAARHPGQGGVHPRPCNPCWSDQHLIRTSNWCCSPRTRRSAPASWRPWPVFYPSVFRRRAVVGPAPRPTRVHRVRSAVTETAGFRRTPRGSSTTRGRSCSIPVRHDMSRPPRQRLARAARRGPPPRGGRGCSRRSRSSSPSPRAGPSGCEPHPGAGRARWCCRAGSSAPSHRRPCGSSTSASARSSGPPGLGHSARPGRRAVGDRGLHRTHGHRRPRDRRPGRPLHAVDARRPGPDATEIIRSVAAVHASTDHDAFLRHPV